jgi:NAD-dependent dihydropyrimidine dehydrogenase PreA subunit
MSDDDAKNCKRPGLVAPVIDRNRCEGKEDCVEVCPYGVFEMGRLGKTARAELSTLGRLKGFFHGYKQAFTVHADRCQACGLCVTACPERAIKLAPLGVGRGAA